MRNAAPPRCTLLNIHCFPMFCNAGFRNSAGSRRAWYPPANPPPHPYSRQQYSRYSRYSRLRGLTFRRKVVYLMTDRKVGAGLLVETGACCVLRTFWSSFIFVISRRYGFPVELYIGDILEKTPPRTGNPHRQFTSKNSDIIFSGWCCKTYIIAAVFPRSILFRRTMPGQWCFIMTIMCIFYDTPNGCSCFYFCFESISILIAKLFSSLTSCILTGRIVIDGDL